jgi:peptide/nickel transport system substrate-binding protein
MSLGPFRVDRWDRAGARLTLALNPHSAFLAKVRAGEHLARRVTLLESEVGRALFDRERVGFVFIDRASALSAGTPKGTVRQPLLSTFFLGMVTDRPPLDRVELRQAISWAIDRDALLSGLLPTARPSPTLLPSELPLSANEAERALLPHHDLARARALLARAGGVGRPLRLIYQAGDNFIPTVAIAERLKRQLAQLGIQVDAEPRADFYAELSRRGPDGRHVVDLYLRRLGADYAHPHTFFTLFLRDGNHQTGWETLEGGEPLRRFEALLDQADAEADEAKARALYVQAERLLVGDEAIIAPLFHPDRYYRVAPNLRGLGVDPFNFLSLAELRVEGAPP